jgi:hypothetical protein
MKTLDIKQVAEGKQAPETFEGSDTVAEINTLHNELFALGKTALEKAIRIGDLLVANKKAVRHGDWLKWIDKKLVFGGRQAQKYISIYEGRDELRALANANSNSYLSIDGYYLLLKKTEHEAAGEKGENVEQQAAVPSDSESKPAVAEREQKQKSVEDENPTGPEDEKTIWRKGLLERAQKATSLAAYDDTWANHTFDAALIDATAQAAAAWNELATYLRERQLPF